MSTRIVKKIVMVIIAVVLLFAVYLNTFLIIKYNILPFKYLIVYFFIVALIPFLLIYTTVFTKIRPFIKSICAFIEIIYLTVLFIVFFYLNQTFNFLEAFTNGVEYETKNYYVITLKNNQINNVNNINNKSIGYLPALDNSINHAIEALDEKVDVNSIEYEGYTLLFNDLYESKVDCLLILQSYYDLLTEVDETIKDKTQITYAFSIKEKVNTIVKDVDITKETFNIYVSAIDSFGDVTVKNRSDVNIIMSVNPKTNKIVMVNIPRDYYVDLYEINQKDKLTHAGMYGVETSVKTIEQLLDIEINYYVKVNYSALINLVDAIGGVNVYSKYAFSTHEYHYKIKQGYNFVDGKKALDFARTRKAFTAGDRVRGENQQALIKAIIEKMSDGAILLKYNDILKSLEGSFATNVSMDKIMAAINMQLDTMPSWKIESYSLNGKDGKGECHYYKGQQLYIMIPDEESVNSVKQILKELK